MTLDEFCRKLEVVIDGEVEWFWGQVGDDEVLARPSNAVLRALVVNAFALQATADAAIARAEAAFALLREKTLEP